MLTTRMTETQLYELLTAPEVARRLDLRLVYYDTHHGGLDK